MCVSLTAVSIASVSLNALSNDRVSSDRDRIKLHCYKHVAFFEGIKECRGYTVLFLLVIKGKKSVGYTVCLHHNDGRKECGVHCLSPSLMEVKSVGYTVCLHHNDGRKECGVHCLLLCMFLTNIIAYVSHENHRIILTITAV